MKILLVGLVLLIYSCHSDNEPRTVNDWPRYIDSLDRIWSSKEFVLKVYWYVWQPGDEGHKRAPRPLIMDYIDSRKFLRYQITYYQPYSSFLRIFYLDDSTWKSSSYKIKRDLTWKSNILADTTFRLPQFVKKIEADSNLRLNYSRFLQAAATGKFTGISYHYNNMLDVTMDLPDTINKK